MGNKQQLQLNNETLASILSNVLGLPAQVDPLSDTDLIPENIREGIDIWGVVGTLVEGVAGIDFGEVTLASEVTLVTVNHNLGVVPSWGAFFPKNLNVSTYGVGKTFANINGFALRIHNMISGNIVNDTANIDLTETTISFESVNSANPKGFEQTTYYWIAIA